MSSVFKNKSAGEKNLWILWILRARPFGEQVAHRTWLRRLIGSRPFAERTGRRTRRQGERETYQLIHSVLFFTTEDTGKEFFYRFTNGNF
jgi:hypothetical protein